MLEVCKDLSFHGSDCEEWRHVNLIRTDISEERVTSIFILENMR
jgi:hypothetical protein